MVWDVVTPNDPSFTYNKSQILGQGAYGTVFSGKYNGDDVAVKRVDLMRVNLREETLLQLDHDNVVKLIHIGDSGEFRFYVLELCAGSLDDYCKRDYKGPIPSDVEVLYQLTIGLEYIHSKCVHRDIKPKNILISNPNPIVKMKWADFGHCKAVNKNGSWSVSNICGTKNWIAPEIIRLREDPKGRGSKKSDIFSVGLVFFYFLKRGVHLFGKGQKIESNIRNDKPVNMHELADDHFAKAFLTKMIATKVNDRIALREIIQVLEPYLSMNPPRGTENQLSVNKTHGVETVFSHKSMPSTAVQVPSIMGPPPAALRVSTRRTKENIMPIEEVLLKNGRKPRSWAIKARVIEKSGFLTMGDFIPGKPARKCFFVVLKDDTGEIKGRACTARPCKKFYPQFTVKFILTL